MGPKIEYPILPPSQNFTAKLSHLLQSFLSSHVSQHTKIAPNSFYSCQSLLLQVNSVGIGCSIGMLFIMLLLVFISIIVFKWEMTKPMGGVMMVLYLVFVIISLGLSECWIICPFWAALNKGIHSLWTIRLAYFCLKNPPLPRPLDIDQEDFQTKFAQWDLNVVPY